jgi:hypothetical protein
MMNEIEHEMAEFFYGYGCWAAPYWFIGPEQGQARHEKDDLRPRIRAWENSGKPDLADLKDFHDHLMPGMWTAERTPLQSTWRKLMLILLTSLGERTDKEDLRKYQRLKLGRKDGQTCLIELSGLPANSSRTKRDTERFLNKRIQRIAYELKTHKPKFVVMYGKSHQKHFGEIIKRIPELDEVTHVGSTAAFFTKHTNARKLSDEHWRSIGMNLSAALNNAKQENSSKG